MREVETIKLMRVREAKLPEKVLPRRLRPLKRVMLRLLDWLKKYDDRQSQDVALTTPLARGPLIERIIEAQRDVLSYEGRWVEPKLLLLGRDEWMELTHEVLDSPYLFSFGIPPTGRLTTFRGLHIVVVPWMKGFLILPGRDVLRRWMED